MGEEQTFRRQSNKKKGPDCPFKCNALGRYGYCAPSSFFAS